MVCKCKTLQVSETGQGCDTPAEEIAAASINQEERLSMGFSMPSTRESSELSLMSAELAGKFFTISATLEALRN